MLFSFVGYNWFGDKMNGILLINKEAGCTSRDVVNAVSKSLNIKQVGHTGTLDPLATGVLVLCVGEATKLVEIITCTDKEYVAEITLGITTDTLDITGIISKEVTANFTEGQILPVLTSMIGTYDQEVPIYSAVKIAGKKLYEYARNNEEVELPKRQVTVKSLELIGEVTNLHNRTIFTIKTVVSKGTYIRSLIRDIAVKLDTLGVMSNLKRTRQGEYKLEDCVSLADVEAGKYQLIRIKDCLTDVKAVVADKPLQKALLNGNILPNLYNTDKVLFVNEDGVEMALYHQYEGDLTKIKPLKMFKSI